MKCGSSDLILRRNNFQSIIKFSPDVCPTPDNRDVVRQTVISVVAIGVQKSFECFQKVFRALGFADNNVSR
jgi:hypothetical protein